jgi:oligoendopeptidase F
VAPADSFAHLINRAAEFLEWSWEQIQPYYAELAERPLVSESLSGWLADWSVLRRLVDERYARLQLAHSQDTRSSGAESRYSHFIQHLYPQIQAAEFGLKSKLLESGMEPPGFEITLRGMKAETEVFRPENLPLSAAEHDLSISYSRIVGTQNTDWEGEQLSASQLLARIQTLGREQREAGWRKLSSRRLEDRAELNRVWQNLLDLRRRMAANAGLADYRHLRWRQLLRFDYTPQDCLQFHKAVERVVVPAAERIYRRARQRLGVDRLRPWDLDQDLYPLSVENSSPVKTEDLTGQAEILFHRLHPRLGGYFQEMRQEQRMDLESRPGKAPGAFCTSFAVERKPFIFMNAAGTARDLRTLLHEAGHAFHVYERSRLPYHHQWRTGMEFAETAALTVELLAASLSIQQEGDQDRSRQAVQAHLEHLEKIILFWPYMAVVDAFQHWAYTHPQAASRAEACDDRWAVLWQRFIPGVDWGGLDPEMRTGWQRKLHIFRYPFYYIEYGIAQLAAVQIWRRAARDLEGTLAGFLQALSSGGSLSIRALYRQAGADFSFSPESLQEAVSFLEAEIAHLEQPD